MSCRLALGRNRVRSTFQRTNSAIFASECGWRRRGARSAATTLSESAIPQPRSTNVADNRIDSPPDRDRGGRRDKQKARPVREQRRRLLTEHPWTFLPEWQRVMIQRDGKHQDLRILGKMMPTHEVPVRMARKDHDASGEHAHRSTGLHAEHLQILWTGTGHEGRNNDARQRQTVPSRDPCAFAFQ